MAPKKDVSNDDNYDLKDGLKEISDHILQPDKFAKLFCDAASTQKSIDEKLKVTLKELVKTDSETRNMLKDLLREIEKEDWKTFVKKVFTILGAIALVILGAILQALSTKYIH